MKSNRYSDIFDVRIGVPHSAVAVCCKKVYMLKRNFKISTVIACLIGALSIYVVSCTKKVDTTTYDTFLGEWLIADHCSDFHIPKLTLAKGDNSYSMKLTYKMGHLEDSVGINYDSCQRDVTVTAIVNSTTAKNYFSINNQTVTDKCGNNYTISGGGYLKPAPTNDAKDTLIVTLVTTTTGGSSACTYKSQRD